MKRLTKRYPNGMVTINAKPFVQTQGTIDREIRNSEPIRAAVERLALYEDTEKVKHGEWQRQNGGFFFLCSCCGKAAATKGNYCHNCGTKMDSQL